MLFRILFAICLSTVLFAGIISCNSDSENNSKGVVAYAGTHTKGSKEFIVLSYSKDDAEDRLDNQADAHFYYVRTYTIDLKSGKVVHETKYDVTEFGGDFLGATENYLFYQSSQGVFAIDIFQSGKVIPPQQVLQMIGNENPALKGQIVSIRVNSDQQLIAKRQDSEQFALNRETLKAIPLNTSMLLGSDYQVNATVSKFCAFCFKTTSFDQFILNDSVSLFLRTEEGAAQEKKLLHLSTNSPKNNLYGYLIPVDKTPFLNGFAFGEKDSVVYLSYLTNLSATGVQKIAAYNWGKHQFLWSKPINSLYTPNEFGNYSTAWNSDGTAFLLWGTDIVSMIDARTGKRLWTL